MKTKQTVLLTFLLGLLLFSSCRKTPDLTELSLNLAVITNGSRNSSFSSYKTYYISDTIANIAGSLTDTIYTGPYALQLVNAIKQNMAARGYTFVTKDQSPDLGINTAILRVTIDQTVMYYPGYWGGYAGYWNPYYWGYGGMGYYYPYGATYSYKIGTFVMNVADLKNATENKHITMIWTGYLLGYLGDNTATNIAAGVSGINTAFNQSSYFTTH
jgi:hypothetical protein